MKKFLLNALKIILGIYVLVGVLLFFFQEKLIFHPQKLEKGFQFQFDQKFEAKNIKTKDGTTLSGLLFKAESSKGLIFYLHGNAGSLNSWASVAKTYTNLNYDLSLLDYRGFGKSEGEITSQAQLHADIQTAYNELKKQYSENKIIVLGYSIGTGPAAKIASANNPRLLILQAPYYSLTDLMTHIYPVIPTFILKYKLETNEYLEACKMPVVIFHGDQDKVVNCSSSLKLKEKFKSTDQLVILKGQGHNGITYNKEYIRELKKLLMSE